MVKGGVGAMDDYGPPSLPRPRMLVYGDCEYAGIILYYCKMSLARRARWWYWRLMDVVDPLEPATHVGIEAAVKRRRPPGAAQAVRGADQMGGVGPRDGGALRRAAKMARGPFRRAYGSS